MILNATKKWILDGQTKHYLKISAGSQTYFHSIDPMLRFTRRRSITELDEISSDWQPSLSNNFI